MRLDDIDGFRFFLGQSSDGNLNHLSLKPPNLVWREIGDHCVSHPEKPFKQALGDLGFDHWKTRSNASQDGPAFADELMRKEARGFEVITFPDIENKNFQEYWTRIKSR